MSNVTCFSLLFSSFFLFAPWFYSLLNEMEMTRIYFGPYDEWFLLGWKNSGISRNSPDIIWLAMDDGGRWSVHDRYFFTMRLKVWESSTQNLSSKNFRFHHVKYVALVIRIHPKDKLGFWMFENKNWGFLFIMSKSITFPNYIISTNNVSLASSGIHVAQDSV